MKNMLKILEVQKARISVLFVLPCISSTCTVYLVTSGLTSPFKPVFIIAPIILLTAVLFACMLLYALMGEILSGKLRESSYRQMIASLAREASTDALTQLYNRMFIDTCLESQIDNSFLLSQQLSIVLLDIDHFKEINDNYGHQTGDKILAQFSDLIMKCVRKTDYAGRFGGDEIIIVLPSTDISTAAVIAQRIESMVNSTILPINKDQSIKMSCSMGISNYPLHSSSKEGLIKAADSALYLAKKSGRNCFKIFGQTVI